LLWLIAAAAVPLLIHLFHRKKAVKRPFPALMLLIQSQKKLARRIRVRQLLLLLLRMAIIAFFAFALSKPFVLTELDISFDEHVPKALVVLIDDSMSMQALDAEGVSRFERAKEAALEALDELEDWDRAALIVASRSDLEPAYFVDSLSELRAELARVQPSVLAVDMRRAVEEARTLLLSSTLPRRELFIVSDAQSATWSKVEGDLLRGAAYLRFRDVGGPISNVALLQPQFEESAEGVLDLSVAVHNDGESAQNCVIGLFIDGDELARASLELEAGAVELVHFSHRRSEASALRVEFRLLEHQDALAVDDSSRLFLPPGGSIRVLLVNGDAKLLPYQDELFYFEKALRPSVRSRSDITPRVVAPEALDAGLVAENDVVVLANVSELDGAQSSALTAFVRGGGGLLLSMGARVNATRVNESLRELLPRPLRAPRRLADAADLQAALAATRIDSVDVLHPVFRELASSPVAALSLANVYSYFLLEPQPRSSAALLASFADGGPALLERKLGAGRVLLWTSTLDRDWTDLPLSQAYVPFTRLMLSHLAQRGLNTPHSGFAGEPLSLIWNDADAKLVQLVGPDGVLSYSPQELEGKLTVSPRSVGFFSLRSSRDGHLVDDDRYGFAVNPPAAESDAQRVMLEEVFAAWQATTGEEKMGHMPSGQLPLWPMLLLLGVLLIYFETLLGFRRAFWAGLARLRRS
jgi:hypothetical protein